MLPATTWGEKIGTVTNSERRISRVRAAVPPPGQTRHDWAIATEFARRLQSRLGRTATDLFPYDLQDSAAGAETIWNEHRESTRGRDLDITGLSWTMLEMQGPQQWPLREGDSTGRERLYEDGVFPTSDGRARFVANAYQPVAEPRESRFPFSLTTGRLRDQWHGMTRTGTLGRLFGHVAEPTVQMNAQDMDRRQMTDGDLVHVTSKRGSIVLPVEASKEVAFSQAFIAMHWGEEFLSGCSNTGERLAGVNAITTSAFCPSSRQPELKHAAVKILKAELPWSLLAVAWVAPGQAQSLREELASLMKLFPFAVCVPFGRERTGLLFRAASYEAAPDELLARMEAMLGLQTHDTLRYADRKKGQRRALRLRRDGDAARLEGFLLAGDTSAQAWIKTLLQDELPAQAYGRLLLAPGAKPPLAVQPRGRQVCTCFNVSEPAIRECLSASQGTDEARLAALQGELQCGTNCGSCVPELKRLTRLAKSLQHAA